MQKEKYGFVYIWRDRKNNRYYIGSHWGHPEDGYICSSNWMRMSHKRRPEDFKRRVLSVIRTGRKELYEEERRWLGMIKDEELGKRYFNYTKNTLVGDGEPWNKGKKYTEEQLQKLKNAGFFNRTSEKIEKQRQTLLSKYASGQIKPHNKGQTGGTNPEHSQRMKGRIPWNKDKEVGATQSVIEANRRIAENKKKTWTSNRRVAQLSGQIHYHSEKPCRKCVGTKRYVSTGQCVDCHIKQTILKRKTINISEAA